MGELNLCRALEAVLFVADGPVGLDELTAALDVPLDALQRAIEELLTQSAERGLTVVRQGQRVQMVTAPEASEAVERYLGTDHAPKLSAAALEALAIVAYRQPVTRAQLEGVRGVNCDGVLRTLTARGLVVPVGRLEQAGRPVLYGTTFDFLEYLGIGSLEELPKLPDEVLAEVQEAESGEVIAEGDGAESPSEEPTQVSEA